MMNAQFTLEGIRTFPVIDATHARHALAFCLLAERYEKEAGYLVFPNKEMRHKIRKSIWKQYQIPPTYFDRDTEIVVEDGQEEVD